MSDTLRVTILGSGSSGGVPRLGGPDNAGNWGACDPANPKNRRRRCSILAQRLSAAGTTTVLVDTAPDLREQLLGARIAELDGVLITHDHADQLHGIDDLRLVFLHQHRRVDIHTDAVTAEGIVARFGYCFVAREGSLYPPIAEMHVIAEPFVPFEIGGAGGPVPVQAFGQQHGHIRSLGFRFGPIAYSSDVSGLDGAAYGALAGVECWIVDALRYTPHSSHFNVEQALEAIARVNPRRAVLTNLHIDLDYETLRRELPAGIEPAYDGMTVAAAV
jgi:phosphoribosyl 1,2-cyclic phosphate phosphodiesterase